MQENTTRIEERLDRLINDMNGIGQRVAAIEAKLDSVEEKVDEQRGSFALLFVTACTAVASLSALLLHIFHG